MSVSTQEIAQPRKLPGRASSKRAAGLITALFLGWLVCLSVGLGAMWRYESTPGAVGRSPKDWPVGTTIELDANLPTLVMFAHPRCPCTRASIAELAELMAGNQGRVAARVCFYLPPGTDRAWSEGDAYHAAAAIEGVSVELDEDNVEAERFGARTSGYALLFNPSGKRLFAGGITAARGHAGDNPGRMALTTLLAGGQPALSETLVFGCPLADPDAPE